MSIPDRERLICALDLPDPEGGRHLVEQLGEAVHFYKLGMEICTHEEGLRLADWLQERDKKVFIDLKLLDIPRSVAQAVRQLAQRGAFFCTVHDGGPEMLEAAVSHKGAMKILVVTSLTSHSPQDLRRLGFSAPLEELVMQRAARALEAGCDGVVLPGPELPGLRRNFGDALLAVTPGIRQGAGGDDQKRVLTAARAVEDGADYIVVGRPIREAPEPRAAAEALQQDIARALEKHG